jgi:hypothetical protein
MRPIAAAWHCLTLVLLTSTVLGCGSESGPTGPRPTSTFAERFSEADALPDGAAKNEKFAEIAKDAAAAGDVDAARNSLLRIQDESLREKSAYKATLAMGKAGKRREAGQLIKSIRDPALIQKAQTKIAQGDWSE